MEKALGEDPALRAQFIVWVLILNHFQEGSVMDKKTKKPAKDYTVEPDYDQLEPAEQAEMCRERNGLKGMVEKISGHLTGLKSALVYGKAGQNMSDAMSELRGIQALSAAALVQCGKLVCLAVVVMMCAGCNGGGQSRQSDDYTTQTRVPDAHGVGGCVDGHCRAR